MNEKGRISRSPEEKFRKAMLKLKQEKPHGRASLLYRPEIALEPLPLRIEKLMETFGKNRHQLYAHERIYFVQYDISNHRIRRNISKYLERKGLQRIQRSIFLGRTTKAVLDEIVEAIKTIQEMYDNDDSILIIPVGMEVMEKMKVIGKELDKELYLGKPSCLFF